jgi:hypothetical protein
MAENPVGILKIDVVQKAVNQDEVESHFWRRDIAPDVRDNELPFVASPGILDIFLIQIQAKVFRMGEMSGVSARTASYIKCPPNGTKVVVFTDRVQLPFGKRSLPKAVHRRIAHKT